MDEIGAILSYREERATFVDNLHNFIEIAGNLLRQIRESPYLEEVEWAVSESYGRKDETAKLRFFAL
jgi:hypothetical protein